MEGYGRTTKMQNIITFIIILRIKMLALKNDQGKIGVNLRDMAMIHSFYVTNFHMRHGGNFPSDMKKLYEI